MRYLLNLWIRNKHQDVITIRNAESATLKINTTKSKAVYDDVKFTNIFKYCSARYNIVNRRASKKKTPCTPDLDSGQCLHLVGSAHYMMVWADFSEHVLVILDGVKAWTWIHSAKNISRISWPVCERLSLCSARFLSTYWLRGKKYCQLRRPESTSSLCLHYVTSAFCVEIQPKVVVSINVTAECQSG